jgi:predicted N-acetyltransferase YhbS
MEIKHRLPTVEEYRKLRSLVGWWDTDEDSTRIALTSSLFSAVASERDSLVGMGRVVGDGGLYFYIQDLIVQPGYQSKGIGRAIMKELMAFIKTNAEPGAYIALMAAKGLEKYYQRFGFAARESDAPGMYQVI